MRRSALVVLALFIAGMAAILWWDWRPIRLRPGEDSAAYYSPNRTTAAATAEPETRDERLAEPPAGAGPLVVTEIAAIAHGLHSPQTTAQDDLQVLQQIVDFYRRTNDGANPAGGLNEEIVDALRGRNPKRLAVFPLEHPSLDSRGQLLDRWGTPYFLHPLARDLLEIRSAGPDRKFGTPDDVDLGVGD